MKLIKQSFKRQIFAIFMITTLIMVICGGILTIQGFQARLNAEYEKKDYEQNQIINNQLISDLELSGQVIQQLSENETIKKSLTRTKNNSLNIYTELYSVSKTIRDFATVDIYQGNSCVYSTSTKSLSKELPLNYSVLREASENKERVVYALDPTQSNEKGADLLLAKEIVSGDSPGFIIIRIEQSEVESRLKNSINAKDGFMLTDRFLRPFCMIGTSEDGKELSLIRKNLFEAQDYNKDIENNVYVNEVGKTGLLSIYITPPALGESAVKAGYQILIFEAIISIFICLLVASRLSAYFSKPINILSSGMKTFRKGDFDTKIELNREDEFEQLAVGFNKMTSLSE